MKIPFYLLGLLMRYGPQHGYRLKQIIEREISDFAKIKLPTIYYHLERLNMDRYVVASPDKEGNRPEKLVYSITEEGEAHFSKLASRQLEESLILELPLDGVFFFRERFDDAGLLNELIGRRQKIMGDLERLNEHRSKALNEMPEQGKVSAAVIFAHHIVHLQAEISWLEMAIDQLSTP